MTVSEFEESVIHRDLDICVMDIGYSTEFWEYVEEHKHDSCKVDVYDFLRRSEVILQIGPHGSFKLCAILKKKYADAQVSDIYIGDVIILFVCIEEDKDAE